MTSKSTSCTDVGRVSAQGVIRHNVHQKGPFSIHMHNDLYRKAQFSMQLIKYLDRERQNPTHIAGGQHG